MDRRTVLKLGTVAGATATTGCASVLGTLAPPGLEGAAAEVREFLGRVERTMGTISEAGPQGLLPEGVLLDTPDSRAADGLFRKSVRSLFLVGSFSDLSQDARAHPAVQERLWAAMPEMDDSVAGMTRLLEGLTPTQRADFNRSLREDPGLPMRVAEGLDTEAQRYGVPLERRLHLRTLAAHTTARLKQSSGMLFDEYTAKARKLAARSGEVAEVERRLAASLGQAAFAELRARTLASAARWQGVEGSDGAGGSLPEPPLVPAAVELPSHQRPAAAELVRRRDRTIRDGAIILGVSGLVAGVSALLVLYGVSGLATAVGVVGFTVGAILLITGLIVILVGAGMPTE
jgi:hypothetical protein